MSKSYRYDFRSCDGFRTSTDNYDMGDEDHRYTAALRALSDHCAMDPADWIEVWTDDEDAGTMYLYRTQEDADADPDGHAAAAWVKRITVREDC